MMSQVFVPVLGLLLGSVASGQVPTPLEALKKTAQGGDTAAMVAVGLAYAQGKLAPKDQAEALRWYRQAAEKGDADGMSLLGTTLLRSGKAGEAEGFQWVQKAAEAGNPEGQAALGMELILGRLAPQDVVQGYAWMVLGAQGGARGVEAPIVKLEMKLLAKPDLQARATTEANRMLAAKGKPAVWRTVHDRAAAGLPEAEYALGSTNFLSGSRGAGPDLKAAYIWLSLAKAHGSKDADSLLPLAESFLKASRTEGPAALAAAQAEVQRRLAPPAPPAATQP